MEDYKIEIYTALITTLLVLIRTFYTKLAESIIHPLLTWVGMKKSQIDERTLTAGRIINNLLLELRIKMNSDRSAIFLFHNGQHFNPSIANNSIWKFTCAYETCKAGVTYESSNMQSLLITNHLDLIPSLWGDLSDGFVKFKCPDCAMDCKKTKNIIIVANTHEMNYGNTKSVLELQGVKKIIMSPIIINSDYVGFLYVSYSFDFNEKDKTNLSIDPEEIKNICEYSNLIGYHLSNKKQGVKNAISTVRR